MCNIGNEIQMHYTQDKRRSRKTTIHSRKKYNPTKEIEFLLNEAFALQKILPRAFVE